MMMPLCLIGCGPCTPVTLKTITLQPVQWSWNDAEDLYIGFWCDFSVQSNGLTTRAIPPGQTTPFSGFEDFYESGSGHVPVRPGREHLLSRGVQNST